MDVMSTSNLVIDHSHKNYDKRHYRHEKIVTIMQTVYDDFIKILMMFYDFIINRNRLTKIIINDVI
jgi:hypothetical protein